MDVCVSLQLQEGNCGEEVEPRLCVLAPVLFLQRSGEGDCRKARCSTIPEKMLQGGGKKKPKTDARVGNRPERIIKQNITKTE